jgi:hypothetical protein
LESASASIPLGTSFLAHLQDLREPPVPELAELAQHPIDPRTSRRAGELLARHVLDSVAQPAAPAQQGHVEAEHGAEGTHLDHGAAPLSGAGAVLPTARRSIRISSSASWSI